MDTNTILKYIIYGLGVIIIIFSIVLVTLDQSDNSEAMKHENEIKNEAKSNKTVGNILLLMMMLTIGILVVAYYFNPRLMLIVFSFSLTILYLIIRACFARRFHFEICWILLVNLGVQGYFLYRMIFDSPQDAQGIWDRLSKLNNQPSGGASMARSRSPSKAAASRSKSRAKHDKSNQTAAAGNAA